MQASWRPPIVSGVVASHAKSYVVCFLAILGVGFMATRRTISLPLVMPPFMPPSLFVSVVPVASIIVSLRSEPRFAVPAKPSPNSTPLTPGIENSRCDITLSAESKKGSPRVGFMFFTRHSTTPPTESPSRATESNIYLKY